MRCVAGFLPCCLAEPPGKLAVPEWKTCHCFKLTTCTEAQLMLYCNCFLNVENSQKAHMHTYLYMLLLAWWKFYKLLTLSETVLLATKHQHIDLSNRSRSWKWVMWNSRLNSWKHQSSQPPCWPADEFLIPSLWLLRCNRQAGMNLETTPVDLYVLMKKICTFCQKWK